MKGTFSISWGKYGGWYILLRYTKRICLGWVAITYFPFDIDEKLNELLKNQQP
jgi:hypothetical protein